MNLSKLHRPTFSLSERFRFSKSKLLFALTILKVFNMSCSGLKSVEDTSEENMRPIFCATTPIVYDPHKDEEINVADIHHDLYTDTLTIDPTGEKVLLDDNQDYYVLEAFGDSTVVTDMETIRKCAYTSSPSYTEKDTLSPSILTCANLSLALDTISKQFGITQSELRDSIYQSRYSLYDIDNSDTDVAVRSFFERLWIHPHSESFSQWTVAMQKVPLYIRWESDSLQVEVDSVINYALYPRPLRNSPNARALYKDSYVRFSYGDFLEDYDLWREPEWYSSYHSRTKYLYDTDCISEYIKENYYKRVNQRDMSEWKDLLELFSELWWAMKVVTDNWCPVWSLRWIDSTEIDTVKEIIEGFEQDSILIDNMPVCNWRSNNFNFRNQDVPNENCIAVNSSTKELVLSACEDVSSAQIVIYSASNWSVVWSANTRRNRFDLNRLIGNLPDWMYIVTVLMNYTNWSSSFQSARVNKP